MDDHTVAALNSRLLEQILRVLMLTPSSDLGPNDRNSHWGCPTLLWGESAVGKSTRIYTVGTSLDIPVETIFGSALEPPDVGGALVPVVDPANPLDPLVRRVPALHQIQEVLNYKHGILFLDEMADAPVAVQKAYQGAVSTRMFGSHKLPRGIRILAAANAQEQGGLYRLGPPMANRFAHFELGKPSMSKFQQFVEKPGDRAVLPGDTLPKLEAMVRENWTVLYEGTASMFVQFLLQNPQLLHSRPADPIRSSRAWPSPRTWTAAIRAMTVALCIGEDQEVIDAVVAGLVGGPAAHEWSTYRNALDIPTYEQIIEGWRPDPNRLDIAYLAYAGVRRELVKSRVSKRKLDGLEVRKVWKSIKLAQTKGLLDIALPVADELVTYREAAEDPETSQIFADAYRAKSRVNVTQGYQ